VGRDWEWPWEEEEETEEASWRFSTSSSLRGAGSASPTAGPGLAVPPPPTASPAFFCWIIQTARWCSRVAPFAASSSGSRLVTAVLGLDRVAGLVVMEEVEMCFGGSGTLNRESSFCVLLGVLGVGGDGGAERDLPRLAYRGWDWARLAYRG